jgi:hypothetical protein
LKRGFFILVFAWMAGVCAWAENRPESRQVKLRWQALDGAAQYEIQVAKNPNMVPAVFAKKMKETEATLNLSQGTFYYRLRGIDDEGNPGPWSDVDAFAINDRPPDLLAPDDRVVFDKKLAEPGLEFKWTAGVKGSQVVFELRDKDGVVLERGADGTSMAWMPTHPGGFRWRVGYRTMTGVQWAQSRVFTVKPEALSLPPEVLAKLKEQGGESKSKIEDAGVGPAYFVLARIGPGITLSEFAAGGLGGGFGMSYLANLEFRWRAPRKTANPWLLSGSVNFEILGTSFGDATLYPQKLFARGFYTHNNYNTLTNVGFAAFDANDVVKDQQVSATNGYFTLTNLATGTYRIEPVLDSGETASPTSISTTVTAGALVNIGTFTITGTFGTIRGTVTDSSNPIRVGVLVVVTTKTVTALPTLSAATLTGASYYLTNSYEDG